MMSRIGRLSSSKTLLLVCDIQEKFAKTIQHFNEIVETSGRLIECARILQLNQIIVTEQYPKGLGHTVPELRKKLEGVKVFEKTQFSMCTKELMDHINQASPDYNSVILCGIEAHACILGTCLDFLEQGKDVHVVVDAVSSRSVVDRKYAFVRMQQSGAFLTTSEAIMLQLCKNANHPKFREIQKLIKTPAPDSGLSKL